MKNAKARSLGVVFKDLMAIKIEENDSFSTSLNKFYGVMRKHGIKQGTWTKGGGRLVNNFEWSMCWESFRNHKILSLDLWLSMSTPPKDLLAYGKRPAVKFKAKKLQKNHPR